MTLNGVTMKGILLRGVVVGLLVSVTAILIGLALGSMFLPYASMRFGFVPDHLSNSVFTGLMMKAFGWLFTVSFASSVITSHLNRTKPI